MHFNTITCIVKHLFYLEFSNHYGKQSHKPHREVLLHNFGNDSNLDWICSKTQELKKQTF